MSTAAVRARSCTCRLPRRTPLARSIASPASANDPRAASTAANRCSPAECLPTGRFSTASAGCRFGVGVTDAGACGTGASGAVPVVVPVPSGIRSDAGPGRAPEAVAEAVQPASAAVPGTAR